MPAFEWYHQCGLSLVMPVGGESSFYTDWYQPAVGDAGTYTYKWEKFLTRELPSWLAADKGIASSGNGTPTDLDVTNPARTGTQLLETVPLASNTAFQDSYIAAGGKNGVFNLPQNGTHSWAYWGQQLLQMKPDIQRVLGAHTAH